ncbi:MAG: hypothetical protein ACLQU1_15490 [Bryobacteraceae bacterium]
MWHRVPRVVWWLFFVWTTVFWWRFGALKWVLVPLFSVACLFIAQEYAAKHWSFGPRLSARLGVLLILCNVACTIWPGIVREFPKSVAAVWRRLASVDRELERHIDPPIVAAQSVLASYLKESSNAGAEELQKEFGKLVEKQREGKFSEEDRKREAELFDRYERLTERIQRIEAIRRSNQTPGSHPPTTPVAPSAPSVASNAPTGRVASAASATRLDPRIERFRKTLVARSGHGMTGILMLWHDTAGLEAVDALSKPLSKFNSDAFRVPAVQEEFGADLVAGDADLLSETMTFTQLASLVIVEASVSCEKRSSIDPELVSCDLTAKARKFDAHGQPAGSAHERGTGASFLRAEAIEQAAQRAANGITELAAK